MAGLLSTGPTRLDYSQSRSSKEAMRTSYRQPERTESWPLLGPGSIDSSSSFRTSTASQQAVQTVHPGKVVKLDGVAPLIVDPINL